MRDIEELKKVLLEEFKVSFDGYYVSSLCGFFYVNLKYKIITYSEYRYLIDQIKKHENYREGYYIWKFGEEEPRINWIKNLI